MDELEHFSLRLSKYKRDAELLRQIHSNKAFRYARFHHLLDTSTLVVTALLTFLGFTGNDRLVAIFAAMGFQLNPEVFGFFFNASVFLVLLLAILNLVLRFQDKALAHNRAIVILTGFRRDVDDLLHMGTTKVQEIDSTLREVRERYKMITEILPPSTDKEFLKSKSDYVKKKEKSQAMDSDTKGTTHSEPPRISLWTEDSLQRILTDRLLRDVETMTVLRTVRDVHAACWVSGGFIRNQIWDYLHGYQVKTPLDDVDVVWFDSSDPSKEHDEKIEEALRHILPNINWSVKNQARMHKRTGDAPYDSFEDALTKWPETATAIAVSLDSADHLKIIAPFGYTDLFRMVVRPTPHFYRHPDRYEERLKEKTWAKIWPKLAICHIVESTETPPSVPPENPYRTPDDPSPSGN